MLTPHACHNVEIKEVTLGNTNKLSYVIRWCLDCDVRVWHDGSNVGEYFINKSNNEYNNEGCILFLLYCIDMSKRYKGLKGLAQLQILLNEIIEMYRERNPIM